MDEILIDEKKYISSKQAAKATGYAKDYIGQLCREGRVPARLVGRSWYVLESAVHDHRFGSIKQEPDEPEKVTLEKPKWESPRYASLETEVLPSVNRLQSIVEPQEPTEEETVVARLQETWEAWFDRFEHVAAETTNTKPEVVTETEEASQEEEIVLIRAIHHEPYQPTPREFLPSYAESEPLEQESEKSNEQLESEEEQEVVVTLRKGRKGFVKTIQVAGIVVAVLTATLAVLGSGYLDEYVVSDSQVGLIAGVVLYNK